MNALLERIIIDPGICHGKPCIPGLRYPVEMILELLSGTMTEQDILENYEDLSSDDIKACLLFAPKLVQANNIYKLPLYKLPLPFPREHGAEHRAT